MENVVFEFKRGQIVEVISGAVTGRVMCQTVYENGAHGFYVEYKDTTGALHGDWYMEERLASVGKSAKK